MASKYPYVQSPSRLCELVRALPTIGRPVKFNQDSLKSLGYTSSNDRTFVAALKLLGFLDAGGAPTALWDELRADPPRAVAEGLRTGYADLFGQYPDAPRRDDEALRAFFSANTDVGAAAVAKMAGTFKALCGLADFSDVPQSAFGPVSTSGQPSAGPRPPLPTATSRGEAAINVNIDIRLPEDATGKAYEAFFRALRRNLLDPE